MAATLSPRTTARLPMTRGRRAALVIGVPVCLAFIANTGFNLVAPFAEGSYPVSYPIPAGTTSLAVATSGGQFSVKAAAAGQARLTGTARYTFIRSALTERTVGGGTDIDAAVTVSTGGGSLSVDHVTGPLNLNANGGNIEAAAITVPASAAFPAFAAATGGGTIRATGVSAPTVTISTGGGNVEIVFTSVPRDVRVDSSGGDITLVLPQKAATYHVNAQGDGGTVSDSLPQNTSSPNQITVTSGGGDITLREPLGG